MSRDGCPDCNIKRAWRSDLSTDPSDLPKCVREHVDSIGYTLGTNLFLTVTGGEFHLCFLRLKVLKECFLFKNASNSFTWYYAIKGETNVEKRNQCKVLED